MRPDQRHPATPSTKRAATSGFSSLVLFALTVQLSLAMLEWGGPGSADTRTRLATTIVAAAHQGVFTEPRRQIERPAPRPETPRLVRTTNRPGPVPTPLDLSGPLVPWSSAIPPPAAA